MFHSRKDLEFELSFAKELINGIDKKIVRDRVQNVLMWDVSGAHRNRARYLTSILLAAVCNAAIPIVVLLRGADVFGIIAAVLSAASSVVLMLNATCKWQDSWQRSRRNAEIVKNRAVLFIHHCGPYAGDDAEERFIQDIENIVMEDSMKWASQQAVTPSAGQGVQG